MSHYKPYPAYKDSGVEWLGRVPEHWDVLRMKSIIESVQNGFWGEDPNGGEDDIPCARVADFDRINFTVTESLPTLRKVPLAQRISRRVNPGDLLIEKSGGGENTSVGVMVQYIGKDPVICSNFVAVVKVKKKAHSRWLSYANAHLYSVGVNTRSIKQTTGIQNIDSDQYFSERVAIPTAQEQLAITAHLDSETARIDTLMCKKKAFLSLLREKRKALISHAVIKGLDPTAPMKDSGVKWLGDVPAHWKVSPLKYVVTFQSGGTPSKENLDYWDGNIPWASAKDMKKEKISDTQDHLTELAFQTGAASLIPLNSVLVVVRGMILARIFPVVETTAPMAINQDLKALIPSKNLEAQYLAHLLRGLADESLRRLEEAGHGTKALRMEAWTSMQLSIPELDEQQEILEYLDEKTTHLDSLISKTELSLNLLKERRSALITAAVTGQIDLREAS